MFGHSVLRKFSAATKYHIAMIADKIPIHILVFRLKYFDLISFTKTNPACVWDPTRWGLEQQNLEIGF